MDKSHATIPVYGGEHLRLYKEVRLINTIYNVDQAINHPIYAIDQYFGCLTLATNDLSNPQDKIEDTVNIPQFSDTNIWKIYFDGAFSKDGIGAGIVLISLDKKNITQSFKLDFEVTNNVEEYEALILRLKLAKILKVQNLVVYGD